MITYNFGINKFKRMLDDAGASKSYKNYMVKKYKSVVADRINQVKDRVYKINKIEENTSASNK